MHEHPKIISIFPLARALLLPRGNLPLVIFEPQYLAMINEALAATRVFGMIQPKQHNANESKNTALYKIGCLGRITSFNEIEDGRLLITLTGLTRFSFVREIKTSSPFRQIEVSYQNFAHDLMSEDGECKIDRNGLLSVLKKYLDRNNLQADWDAIAQASSTSLVSALSIMSPFGVMEKQALLEAENSVERCALLIALTKMALAQNDDNVSKPTIQ